METAPSPDEFETGTGIVAPAPLPEALPWKLTGLDETTFFVTKRHCGSSLVLDRTGPTEIRLDEPITAITGANHRNGQRLVYLGCKDGTIHLWQDGRAEAISWEKRSSVTALHWDKGTLYAGYADGLHAIVDDREGIIYRERAIEGPIVAIAKRGHAVAYANRGLVYFPNLGMESRFDGEVLEIGFVDSEDGPLLLALVRSKGTTFLYEVRPGEPRRLTDVVSPRSFSTLDDKVLVSAEFMPRLQIWRHEKRRLVYRMQFKQWLRPNDRVLSAGFLLYDATPAVYVQTAARGVITIEAIETPAGLLAGQRLLKWGNWQFPVRAVS